MDTKEVQLLKRIINRQKKACIQMEKILGEKPEELYDATYHLKEANVKLENRLNKMTSELDGFFVNIIRPYVVMDFKFNMINMNGSAKEFLGYDYMKDELTHSNLVHEDFV